MQREYSIYIKNLSKIISIVFIAVSFFSTNAWALFEKVASAQVTITDNKDPQYLQKIKLQNNINIHIRSHFPKDCFDEDGLSERNDCFPITELYIEKNNKEFDNTKIINSHENWRDVFTYFVKIAPNTYYKDLDKDGNFEIALFPMVAGNAVPCSAYVYSVKGTDLVFYGTGWLSWESFTKEDDNKFVYGIKKIN
jgi:hypothetical protein